MGTNSADSWHTLVFGQQHRLFNVGFTTPVNEPVHLSFLTFAQDSAPPPGGIDSTTLFSGDMKTAEGVFNGDSLKFEILLTLSSSANLTLYSSDNFTYRVIPLSKCSGGARTFTYVYFNEDVHGHKNPENRAAACISAPLQMPLMDWLSGGCSTPTSGIFQIYLETSFNTIILCCKKERNVYICSILCMNPLLIIEIQTHLEVKRTNVKTETIDMGNPFWAVKSSARRMEDRVMKGEAISKI